MQNPNGSDPPGTVYGADKQFTTKIPYHGADKYFETLSAIPVHRETIHIHHPALLKVTRATPQGEEIIFDDLSSLEQGYIEADVVFPLDCPATIAVTIITGKRYTYTLQ
ncbi:unnamed protein product [marine sediment metagenome]|uniref:Uncharacterized protein n=1 Tax=marine sediment metagenome TaxID=412755 RepID=X1KAP3_9ZZZZ